MILFIWLRLKICNYEEQDEINGKNKNVDVFLLLLPFIVFVNVYTVSASVKMERVNK